MQYEGCQWERVILNLQVKSILESAPVLGLPRGVQYPYNRGANQADVCYGINFQVDMGANIGMYDGVQSTFSSIRTTTRIYKEYLVGEHEIEDYCHHWGRCKV